MSLNYNKMQITQQSNSCGQLTLAARELWVWLSDAIICDSEIRVKNIHYKLIGERLVLPVVR